MRKLPNSPNPLVGIIMGSASDWESTMVHAWDRLNELEIPSEKRVLSAHRTPGVLEAYSQDARRRGIEVLIAGAGGAAHLPGMSAAQADYLPVLGVPVMTADLHGVDSLLSILQMPADVPVGTLAIGKKGAINAAMLAAEILVGAHPEILARLRAFGERMRRRVAEDDERIAAI